MLEQQMKPGDMMISDARGVISSIVYGPDQRTRITPETTRVLLTVSPDARTELLEVLRAE